MQMLPIPLPRTLSNAVSELVIPWQHQHTSFSYRNKSLNSCAGGVHRQMGVEINQPKA